MIINIKCHVFVRMKNENDASSVDAQDFSQHYNVGHVSKNTIPQLYCWPCLPFSNRRQSIWTSDKSTPVKCRGMLRAYAPHWDECLRSETHTTLHLTLVSKTDNVSCKRCVLKQPKVAILMWQTLSVVFSVIDVTYRANHSSQASVPWSDQTWPETATVPQQNLVRPPSQEQACQHTVCTSW